MKIGITGSTCSGKTTLINYLNYRMDNLRTTVAILNERAMECPYPLNEKGGFRTQQWIMSQHIIKEYELQKRFPVVITDRTVFDGIAYLQIALHTHDELDFSTKVAEEWGKRFPYDYVIYLAPLTNVMPKEKVPYQLTLDKLLRTVISYNISHSKISYIPVDEKEARCENTYELIKLMIGEQK